MGMLPRRWIADGESHADTAHKDGMAQLRTKERGEFAAGWLALQAECRKALKEVLKKRLAALGRLKKSYYFCTPNNRKNNNIKNIRQ